MSISVLPITIFNFFLVNKYLPLSEGWWITYAYLMQSGLEIFKDFRLPTAPLFVYLYSLIYGLIDNDYILVKYVGIAVNSGLFLFINLLLRQYFNSNIASLATILASFLYITSPVYAPHDYHVLVDLFVVVSIYMLLIASGTNDKKFQFINSFIAGVIASALFFTKQNVGIFIIFGQLISLIYYKKIISIFFGYALGILFFANLFSYLVDYPLSMIVHELVFQSDSKGSAFKVLFRFLIEWSIAKTLAIALLLAFAFKYLCINKNLILNNKYFYKITIVLKSYLFFLKNTLIILLTSSVAAFYLIGPSFNSKIILTCVISYIFYNLMYNLKKDNNNYSIIFLSMFFLLYTNTQTGGIANWGTIIASALFFAVVFSGISIKYSIVPIYALLLISVGTIAYAKLNSPYEFWGSIQTSALNKQVQLPYKQLNKIYVGDDTHNLFNRIKIAIDENSKNIKDIYLYPNIPIFYYLHDKLPPTNVLGQWFDFINKDQVNAELTYLKATPPRLIILFDPPNNVYDGHEGMLGYELGQRKIISLLNDYISKNRYKIIDQSLFCENIVRLQDYQKKRIRLQVQFIVAKALPTNYSVKNLLENFPGVEVITYSSKELARQSSEINLDQKFGVGDGIILNLDASILNPILDLFGDINKSARNIGLDSCYHLKILREND